MKNRSSNIYLNTVLKVYDGVSETFSSDEHSAFNYLTTIIFNMNKMQDEEVSKC